MSQGIYRRNHRFRPGRRRRRHHPACHRVRLPHHLSPASSQSPHATSCSTSELTFSTRCGIARQGIKISPGSGHAGTTAVIATRAGGRTVISLVRRTGRRRSAGHTACKTGTLGVSMCMGTLGGDNELLRSWALTLTLNECATGIATRIRPAGLEPLGRPWCAYSCMPLTGRHCRLSCWRDLHVPDT
jgi:hypothetical protein